jgi:hypothetical protein
MPLESVYWLYPVTHPQNYDSVLVSRLEELYPAYKAKFEKESNYAPYKLNSMVPLLSTECCAGFYHQTTAEKSNGKAVFHDQTGIIKITLSNYSADRTYKIRLKVRAATDTPITDFQENKELIYKISIKVNDNTLAEELDIYNNSNNDFIIPIPSALIKSDGKVRVDIFKRLNSFNEAALIAKLIVDDFAVIE